VTTDELRALFLRFFAEKDHTVIPSSSLVPRGDPTLLLTSAGMVQIKPYFLGKAVPPNRRLASCQKCFRTTDIESVGDSTHLTLFEMLGNFSVGDYFKKEAISWGWEFVTRWLKLPEERLWITIFLDDDESYHYWRQLGIAEDRILRFGEQHNFWGPAGDSGPCGPCSEIHYDFGESIGCGKDTCAPGCDCGRFSELWNLVFTQYNQDEYGNRTLLPKPNIDTGMGLERTAVVMQGKTSVYETELFVPLLERISGISGKDYGADVNTDKAMRVVTEHGRGVAFLIADGVIPGNEGTGYVLRRLLRRAALFGKRLGLDKPFLAEIAEIAIGNMGHIYSELKARRDFILKVIENEETRFEETLSNGLELLDGIMEKAAGNGERQIAGGKIFELYDTYGFPVELTMEVATDRGFVIDMDGFESEMKKQRARARASQKLGEAEKTVTGMNTLDINKTPFLGYHRLEHNASIVSILVDNNPVQRVAAGQEASLVLDATPFYGEMGGQMGDTGEIGSGAGWFTVENTIHITPEVIVHQGRVTDGNLSVGDKVTAVVDAERRLDIARNHTATHLLQYALHCVLGEHVQQRGSLVTPERFRFDFSHLTAMTKEELLEVQHMVNENIRRNLIVVDITTTYTEALEEGAVALFDEKYGDTVRVIKIGEPAISAELCGGTHVSTTGELGLFQILGETSIGAGLRRIEAVTGRAAEKLVDLKTSGYEEMAQFLEASIDEVPAKVADLLDALNAERRQRQALERELAAKLAESLLSQAEVINGVMVLVAGVSSTRVEILREMSDRIREKLKSGIIVLGSVYEDKPVFIVAVTPDLISKGYDAGKMIREVARVTGGGGGGKAGLAQAGGKYKNKLEEALRLARSLV